MASPLRHVKEAESVLSFGIMRSFEFASYASLALSLWLPATALAAPEGAGSSAAAPPVAGSATPAAAKDAPAAARGWVSLEQNGKTVSNGVLLGGDGRILTAFRPPQNGEPTRLTVRYSDGVKVSGRVVHTDTKLGLALLVPEKGKRKDGIHASEKSPDAESLRAWISPSKVGATVKVVPYVHAKGTPEETTGLFQAFPSGSFVMGTPFVDNAGDVLGITTRLCAGSPAPGQASAPPQCTTEALVPVALIRRFLGRAPATAAMPTVWLGIAGDPTTLPDGRGGVRVLAVAPKSPAEKAKIVGDPDPAKSDVVVAVEGKPTPSIDELAAQVGNHGIGDKVKFDLVRGGKKRTVTLVLEAPP